MRENIKLYQGRIVGLIFISIVGIILGCGRDISSSNDNNVEENRKPSKPEINLDRYILSQSLACADDDCPENIAKLVVKDNKSVKTCMGFLLSPNKVLTTASCLPRSLRIPNLDCTNDIFAIFPKTRNLEMEKISCLRMLKVDENSYREPALWTQDLAVFELYNRTERSVLETSSIGISAAQSYETWSLKDISDNESLLEKRSCDMVFNTYLNPYSVSGQSPMVIGKDCDFGNGALGAPLMSHNKVYGVFSSFMDERMRSYLITSGLLLNNISTFYHFTNMACAELSETNFYLVGNNLPSCNIMTSVKGLDYKRSLMLRDKDTHRDSLKEYRKELRKINKYFKWDYSIKWDEFGKLYAKPTRPSCINKADEWVDEFRNWRGAIYSKVLVEVEYPQWSIKTKLDENLKPVSDISENSSTLKFQAEFNPFEAFVNNSTYVKIMTEYNGQSVEDTYEEVTNNCN